MVCSQARVIWIIVLIGFGRHKVLVDLDVLAELSAVRLQAGSGSLKLRFD